MKKQLTTLFLVAAALLMPLSLTSCGEDVQLNENGGNNGKPKTGTKFSSGGSGTRTTIDDMGLFYWQDGDKIWVDETGNGDFALMSDQITLGADHRTADFFFNGKDLTNKTYNLIYTGSNATAGSQKTVTIASSQKQKGFDNAEHIGTSGDCATASATQDAIGDYSFTLDHKAHYLVLQPYKAAAVTDDWKLVSIEITDYDGNALCGTYDFDMAGLSNPTSTGNTVTVELVNDAGTSAPESLPTSATRSVYAVISPDDANNRNLRIRYNIMPTGSGNGVAGGTFTIMKELSKTFAANGVTKIQHELTVRSYSTNLFYQYDATVGEYYWKGVSNPPTALGAYADGWPALITDPSTAGSDSRDYSVEIPPTQAHRSCKDMPNANVMSWYVMAGDPRWVTDGEAHCINDNYANVVSHGVWLLKKEHILANEGITEAYMNSVSYDRTTNLITTGIDSNTKYMDQSVSYRTKGTPSDAELHKYFFLPALGTYLTGYYSYGVHQLSGAMAVIVTGNYWTSTPSPRLFNGSYNGGEAMVLDFMDEYIYAGFGGRMGARIVEPTMFK